MPEITDGLPEDCVFIIDGLMSALTAAILAKGRPMRCIYECKRIEWRDVDFVALYDLLLSDQQIIQKRVVEVPHPYRFGGTDWLQTARWQRKFVRDLAAEHVLDTGATYVGCVTSSLMLANKHRVRHILMDEGMDSIMTRHRLYTLHKSKWYNALRSWAASQIFPFRFSSNAPQVTLAGDEHPAIIQRLDYREFHSEAFSRIAKPLESRLAQCDNNVLVLLKGPPHLSAQPVSRTEADYQAYVDYNRGQIVDFLEKSKLRGSVQFFLKAHPSLGSNSPLISMLSKSLLQDSVVAYDICGGLEFPELPSVPAEVYLATGFFGQLLSLDISSTLWHVARGAGLSCHLPLVALMAFVSKNEGMAQLPLYQAQSTLNSLNGNHVNCY